MPVATANRRVDFRNLRALEVILKITERCNLDCDYCYFFNAGGRQLHETFGLHIL